MLDHQHYMVPQGWPGAILSTELAVVPEQNHKLISKLRLQMQRWIIDPKATNLRLSP